MKNWKTSLFGIVAALAGFISFSPQLFTRWPWVVDLAKYIMAGGLAGIGFAAKDSSTHSTPEEVAKAEPKAEPKV